MKAARLQFGDTIGIVSPSWGGAGMFPHRFQQGVLALETLGFKVKIAPHALRHSGFISDTATNRVADLHTMFADPEVRAIISTIGGDHACHLLPHLDYALIQQNPKIFIGYSDISVLNVALWVKTGLITFNGPTLLADFAEWPVLLDYTRRHFLQATCDPAPLGVIAPAQEWTDEYLEWSRQEDRSRSRRLQPTSGWRWLKQGRAEGLLTGGCLASLQHLRGTPYWPTWSGALFFFELSGDRPDAVDSILMDYENMGVWDKIAGLLVGRPLHYTEAERQMLYDILLERTHHYDFPIIADMDFGHTAPQFTLPLGCRARMDSAAQCFEILEAAVT